MVTQSHLSTVTQSYYSMLTQSYYSTVTQSTNSMITQSYYFTVTALQQRAVARCLPVFVQHATSAAHLAAPSGTEAAL